MDADGMTSGRRQRLGAAGALALAVMFGVSGSTVRCQTEWPFQLEWNHPGGAGVYYRLCANGQCSILGAAHMGGTLWRAPLPTMQPGEYRLVVEACTGDTCLAGTPDLMIRVVTPSRRRPPIDVISGPRVEIGVR